MKIVKCRGLGNLIEAAFEKKAWLTPDWSGPDIKSIVNSKDDAGFKKWLQWLGMQIAENPSGGNLGQMLAKYDAAAPGLMQWFKSNGAYNTSVYQGTQQLQQMMQQNKGQQMPLPQHQQPGQQQQQMPPVYTQAPVRPQVPQAV